MVKEYVRGDSVQLSKNFRVREFACKCKRCTDLLVDDALVDWLQKIRDHFGRPVNINSGYRCERHNAAVGGSKTSHHMRGMAADIRVAGVLPVDVARYAESVGVQRIGLYEGSVEGDFVHIGSEPRKRFWIGHAGANVSTFLQKQNELFEVEIPVLHRGCKGNCVKALQAHLLGYGYSIGKKGIDGSFGADTEKAVKRYQVDNDLTEDGRVGPITRKCMLGI